MSKCTKTEENFGFEEFEILAVMLSVTGETCGLLMCGEHNPFICLENTKIHLSAEPIQ